MIRRVFGTRAAGFILAVALVGLALFSFGRWTAPRQVVQQVAATDPASAEVTVRDALTWGLDGRNALSAGYADGLAARNVTPGVVADFQAFMNAPQATAMYERLGGAIMLTGGGSAFRGFPVTVTELSSNETTATFEAWTVFIVAGGIDQTRTQTWATYNVVAELVDGKWAITEMSSTEGPTPGAQTGQTSTVEHLMTVVGEG